MFIEKLSQEDIAYFLSNKHFGIKTKIPDIHKFDNPVAFNKFNGALVFESEYICYIFTDYEYAEIDKNRTNGKNKGFVTRFDKDWINFMYNRFGEKYKTSFSEYRQANKKAALKQAEQKYDEETKKIEDKVFD